MARIAGWVAHHLEEWNERPVRYRGIARAGGVIPGPSGGPALPCQRAGASAGRGGPTCSSPATAASTATGSRPCSRDLEALGHEVWLDEQLSGGQLWWDEILGHIRTCDAFLFLVSPASVASEACLAEFGYAQDLGRTVIPIELESMNPALLPSALGQHQLVSYSEGSRAELMALSRALGRLADGRPLPDPLPAPPPLPGGYFSHAPRRDRATADDLTLEQQLGVLHRLRARADDGSSDEILTLLATFRRRDDLYATVAVEADELRDAVTAAAASAARWRRRRCATVDEDGPTTCSAG